MNKQMIMAQTTTPNSPELQLCPASPDAHDVFRRTLHSDDHATAFNIQPITTIRPHHQNPTKKRTKMIRFYSSGGGGSGGGGRGSGPSTSHSGVITKKKPDPSAPKITRPCTECGKRFWSWKALFGHMRCHPERTWRGINPPPNILPHHHPPLPPPEYHDSPGAPTEEDEYVAACLLMLANTNTNTTTTNTTVTTTHATTGTSHHHHYHCTTQDTLPDPDTRFECSSCKKVFGSHQALGGHRASHKNVKGCFAITRTDYAGTEEFECGDQDQDHTSHCDRNADVFATINQQHKCSICFKSFSTGQALGGHKRCHLEKEDTVVLSQPFRFDLNFPAPVQDNSTCSNSDLDLILHL